MENNLLDVLIPLNGYLTIKSAAILKSVCKMCKLCIEVKPFNYYPLFKRLKFTKIQLIKLIVRTDSAWLRRDSNARNWHDINQHKYGKNIKEYVSKLFSYKVCVSSIERKDIKNPSIIYDDYYIYEHCIDFINHFTMCGIFSQLCLEFIIQKHYNEINSIFD